MLRGGATELRVMSYSLSARAFSVDKQPGCRSRSGTNKCVHMIAFFIAQYLPDILCLQDVDVDTDWPQLLDALHTQLPAVHTLYSWSVTRAGGVGMVTVINKRKYRVMARESGDFLSDVTAVKSGRPFLGLLLNDNTVIMNVHMPTDDELVPKTVQSCFNRINTVYDLLTASSGVEHHFILAGNFARNAVEYLNEHAAVWPATSPVRRLVIDQPALNTYFDVSSGKFAHKFDHIFSDYPRDMRQRYSALTLKSDEMKVLMDAVTGRPVMSDHLPVFLTVALPVQQQWNPVWTPPPPTTLSQIPSNALYLIHTTAIKGHATSVPDPTTWTELRRPAKDGVYATLITTDNYDVTPLFGATFDRPTYVFQLPLNLLTYKNYHLNLVDQNGLMHPTTTFMPWQLDAAIKQIKRQSKFTKTKFDELYEEGLRYDHSIGYNEVVFAQPLSLPRGCFRVTMIPPTSKKVMLVNEVFGKDRFVVDSDACRFFSNDDYVPCFPPVQGFVNADEQTFQYDVPAHTRQLHLKSFVNTCLQEPADATTLRGLPQQFENELFQHEPRWGEYADWDEYQQSGEYKDLQEGGMYTDEARAELNKTKSRLLVELEALDSVGAPRTDDAKRRRLSGGYAHAYFGMKSMY